MDYGYELIKNQVHGVDILILHCLTCSSCSIFFCQL